MNRLFAIAGISVLLLAWAGPLPSMVESSFTAHMLLHMAVVGIGVPLLAAGIAPATAHWRLLGAQRALPLVVSVVDLLVVWGWHAPLFHRAARASGQVLALEQASFAAVSLMVWIVALSPLQGKRGEAALAGALTLFFTSMHMTLLGALIALSRQPIFGHHHGSETLSDQQLGGAIMLVIGGVIYLGGALALIARVLRPSRSV